MSSNKYLRSIEEAKEFFKSYGCSHFYMAREDNEQYNEYLSFEISKDLESQWKSEEILLGIETLKSDKSDIEKLWIIHSRVADLFDNSKLICKHLNDFYETTLIIQDKLSLNHALLVAETLIGRSDISYRHGLVFLSYDTEQEKLADKFIDLAFKLTALEIQDQKLENRRQAVISTLEKTKILFNK